MNSSWVQMLVEPAAWERQVEITKDTALDIKHGLDQKHCVDADRKHLYSCVAVYIFVALFQHSWLNHC